MSILATGEMTQNWNDFVSVGMIIDHMNIRKIEVKVQFMRPEPLTNKEHNSK